MPFISIKDLIFGQDLLDEVRLKPWWEKLRGYCLTGSLTTTLYMMFIFTTQGTIDCEPVVEATNNGTFSKLTTTNAAFLNNYCIREMPWFVTYFQSIALVYTVVLFAVSNIWLTRPKTIEAFRAFAKSEELIAELNIQPEVVRSLTEFPRRSAASGTVREACKLLWKYNDTSVLNTYKWRNGMVISLTVILLGLSLYACHFQLNDQSYFFCKVDDHHSVQFCPASASFLCVYKLFPKIFPATIVFVVLVTAQVFSLSLGCFCTHINTAPKCRISCLDKESSNDRCQLTDSFLSSKIYADFMCTFWKGSSPVESAMDEFVSHIYSRAISKNLTHILTGPTISDKKYSTDAEYFHQLCYMRKDAGDDIVETFAKEYRYEKIKYAPTATLLLLVLKKIKFHDWNDNVKGLARRIAEEKQWKLLVALLNAGSSLEDDDYAKLKIGQHFFHGRNSIGVVLNPKLLYYAVKKDPEFCFNSNAIKCIVACSNAVGSTLSPLKVSRKLKSLGQPTWEEINLNQFLEEQFLTGPTLTDSEKNDLKHYAEKLNDLSIEVDPFLEYLERSILS